MTPRRATRAWPATNAELIAWCAGYDHAKQGGAEPHRPNDIDGLVELLDHDAQAALAVLSPEVFADWWWRGWRSFGMLKAHYSTEG